MAKRQIKPKRPERLEHLIPHVEDDKPDEGKRIVVMLSPELAERVEVQMNIQDRDALISTMLTEYLDEQDEQHIFPKRHCFQKQSTKKHQKQQVLDCN